MLDHDNITRPVDIELLPDTFVQGSGIPSSVDVDTPCLLQPMIGPRKDGDANTGAAIREDIGQIEVLVIELGAARRNIQRLSIC